VNEQSSTSMLTYEELGFPVTEGRVTYNEKCALEYMRIMDIIKALKDVVVVALTSGFSKTSDFIQDHIKYIKQIQTAKFPIAYTKFVANKLFPDSFAYNAKIAKVRELYKGKEALITKLEILFELYYNLPKDVPPENVTLNEAEDILAELLRTS
jgi:hypothetical protein